MQIDCVNLRPFVFLFIFNVQFHSFIYCQTDGSCSGCRSTNSFVLFRISLFITWYTNVPQKQKTMFYLVNVSSVKCFMMF